MGEKPLRTLNRKVNKFNPFMPTVAFGICCPRDCVSRHNGGTAGAPLKPLRVDSALRALSSLRGLRGAPAVPPLCRETSVSRTANVGTVGKNGLIVIAVPRLSTTLFKIIAIKIFFLQLVLLTTVNV